MFDQPVQNYVIAGIILVFIIMGGVSLIGLTMVDEQSGIPNVDLSEADQLKYKSFNDSANRINDMNDAVEGFYNNIIGKNADPGIFGWLDSIISLIWTPFNAFKATFLVIPTVLNALFSTFMPVQLAWIPTTLIMIVSVIVIFAVIALVFRIKV